MIPAWKSTLSAVRPAYTPRDTLRRNPPKPRTTPTTTQTISAFFVNCKGCRRRKEPRVSSVLLRPHKTGGHSAPFVAWPKAYFLTGSKDREDSVTIPCFSSLSLEKRLQNCPPKVKLSTAIAARHSVIFSTGTTRTAKKSER